MGAFFVRRGLNGIPDDFAPSEEIRQLRATANR